METISDDYFENHLTKKMAIECLHFFLIKIAYQYKLCDINVSANTLLRNRVL